MPAFPAVETTLTRDSELSNAPPVLRFNDMLRPGAVTNCSGVLYGTAKMFSEYKPKLLQLYTCHGRNCRENPTTQQLRRSVNASTRYSPSASASSESLYRQGDCAQRLCSPRRCRKLEITTNLRLLGWRPLRSTGPEAAESMPRPIQPQPQQSQ